MPADIISPRANTTQQVNTVRRRLLFSRQGDQLIGSIPVGSFINKVEIAIDTAFNGGTNPITLGVTLGGAELIAAGDNTPSAVGYAESTRGRGTALTAVPGVASPPAAPIGDPMGGVGLWLRYAPTGAAPNAGQATIVVSFTPPNDA